MKAAQGISFRIAWTVVGEGVIHFDTVVKGIAEGPSPARRVSLLTESLQMCSMSQVAKWSANFWMFHAGRSLGLDRDLAMPRVILGTDGLQYQAQSNLV